MNERTFSICQQARIWFCLGFFAAANLAAEDFSSAFNDANRLFEQGKYSDAVVGYEKMIRAGTVSVPLYFNLGNAFLKSGQVGRAIVAYRNAEQMSPRDPDVRANLQFARDQAGGGTSPSRDRWKNWVSKLTLNEWAILASSSVCLWFLFLAARQWKRDWRNSFRGMLAVLGLVGALVIVCLVVAFRYRAEQSSVVIVREAVVRRGPFDESPSAFTLRDGTEVTVLDKKDDWLQVADPAQRTGWLQGRQLISLNEPLSLTKK